MLRKIWGVLLSELAELPLLLVRNLPGRSGVMLRRLYWRARLGQLGSGVIFGRNVQITRPVDVFIGDNCWIDDNVTLIAGAPGERPGMKREVADPIVQEGRLEIGERCHIGVGVVIQAHGGVRIGRLCGLATGSLVYSLTHHYCNPDDPSDERRYVYSSLADPDLQFLLVGPVVLGEGATLGLNAMVLPGTHLGDYACMASGSLRRGDAPDGAIIVGNPPRILKKRAGFG